MAPLWSQIHAISGKSHVVATSPLTRGRGEHVLYIDDDDEVMLLMVEQLLLKLGYRATCMADPCATLAAVRAQAGLFDVVVTDFNMPQMSGLDLARALHDCDAGLPVVISSGYIPEQLRSDAQAARVAALMRKEHTLDDLAALVERALPQFPKGASAIEQDSDVLPWVSLRAMSGEDIGTRTPTVNGRHATPPRS